MLKDKWGTELLADESLFLNMQLIMLPDMVLGIKQGQVNKTKSNYIYFNILTI